MLAPLQQCDGVETEIKEIGQLEGVISTKLYSNYFYECPLCGYSAVNAQPEDSGSDTDDN